jgi:hypothetical protein
MTEQMISGLGDLQSKTALLSARKASYTWMAPDTLSPQMTSTHIIILYVNGYVFEAGLRLCKIDVSLNNILWTMRTVANIRDSGEIKIHPSFTN